MARLRREGAHADRIRFLPNWVDVERFRMRGPLPDRPRRALVFSNRATEANFLAALRGACGVAGIDLDVAGLRMKSLTSRPEEILPHYDLVFAKGRAAMEALAMGTAAPRFASRWPKWVVAEQYWRRFGRFTQLSQMPLIRALLPR